MTLAALVEPWPESLLAFEQMWARLAEHTHLVAIDLPGFGHSERRDVLLSPRAMGEFVVRAADSFGLESPHAVGPDIGRRVIFLSGDDAGAKTAVAELFDAAGFFAIDLGDLVTGGRMQQVGGPLPSHNLVRLPPST